MKYNQRRHSLCGLDIGSCIKEDGSVDHKSNESIPLHYFTVNEIQSTSSLSLWINY